MQIINTNKKGFTLLEILLVITLIGILISILLVAINPNRQLAQARNLTRKTDINNIYNALQYNRVKNRGVILNTITTSYQEICDTGTRSSTDSLPDANYCNGKLDLRVLVPTNINSIPKDSRATGTGNTGYEVAKTSDNQISIRSKNAELGENIAINLTIVTAGLALHFDTSKSEGFDSNENLYTQSKDFSSGWSPNQVTMTSNSALAPDGTNTAALITTNTVAAYNTVEQTPTLSTNTDYCYSVFVKLANGTGTSSRVVFGAANNLISPVYASWGLQLDTLAETTDGSTPTIKGYIPYPNGWYRIYMVINTSTQTNPYVSIRFGTAGVDNVSTFHIWGAQLEKGNYPSTYYPTAGTVKTRGTTWTDLSGNNNNGTLLNGVGYSATNGGSLNFNGSNQYVSTPITGTFSQITFDFWGFFDDLTLSTTSRSESAFGDWNSNRIHFGTRWCCGVGIHFNVNGTWQTTPPTNLRYGWNHYVLVYDTVNNLKRVYLNNILSSSNPTTGNIVLGDFRIGVATNLNQYYKGNISNFRIYNRALTDADIQQNYNATKSRFGL